MMDYPEAVAENGNRVGAGGGDEAEFIGGLLGQVEKAPESARKVNFRLGEDSDGDPAVWISIIVEDDLAPSRKKIADLSRYSRSLRDAVLNSGIGRWPYIQIKSE